MASYAGAYGAGAASEELHRLLAERFEREKFSEHKRRSKADEDAREKERQDTSEYRRQERVARAQRDEADRQLNYEDRKERSRQFNTQMQDRTTDRMVRVAERADDAAQGLEGEDRARKARIEDREDNQNFQLYLDSRRASRDGEGRKPPFQWVNRGGKPVYTNEVLPGDTPQNSREQGRPVLSSDANRITDIDAALADLADLEKNLPKGSTGLLPSLAAQVPQWAAGVVESSSGGLLPAVAAQKRQAVIDRVRQIVGKGMEGGVLRKEDEAKYKNIIPGLETADDQIVTMLTGLRGSLSGRRQQQLENLGAAGYDVSRFSSATGPAVGTRGVVHGQDAVWDGKGWLPVPPPAPAPPAGAEALFSSRR